MTDFAAIDFETANGQRSSVGSVAEACGCPMENHHHALADAEACARIALRLL